MLKITIEGPTKSGKTTLAAELQSHLQDLQVDALVAGGDGGHSRLHDDVLRRNILRGKEVVIVEQQARRSPPNEGTSAIAAGAIRNPLAARVEELEKALKPFADYGRACGEAAGRIADSACADLPRIGLAVVSAGHWLAAMAALPPAPSAMDELREASARCDGNSHNPDNVRALQRAARRVIAETKGESDGR